MRKIPHSIVGASLAALAMAGTGMSAHAVPGDAPGGAGQIAQASPERADRDPSAIRADRIIGSGLYHANGEKVGNIESVLVDRDGRIRAVIVGVGGFLGIGQRNVAIGWDNLNPGETGYRMTTSLSEEALKALPEYRFPSEKDRGTAFQDPNYRAPEGRRGGPAPITTKPDRAEERTAARAEDRDVRTKGWSKAVGPQGDIRATGLVGTPVMNAANEKIGEIEELVIGKGGELGAVVSVGGFLGMGERHVLLAWKRLTIDTKDQDVRVTVDTTREQLERMPAYRKD